MEIKTNFWVICLSFMILTLGSNLLATFGYHLKNLNLLLIMLQIVEERPVSLCKLLWTPHPLKLKTIYQNAVLYDKKKGVIFHALYRCHIMLPLFSPTLKLIIIRPNYEYHAKSIWYNNTHLHKKSLRIILLWTYWVGITVSWVRFYWDTCSFSTLIK